MRIYSICVVIFAITLPQATPAARNLGAPAVSVRSIGFAVPPQGRRDYLSDEEADKIRDTQDPNDRIKLYISFASDRLKKFQYELARKSVEYHRSETLNGLLNGYQGCVDDAADMIQLELDKQGDIRSGLKEMTSKGKEFLATLQKIQSDKGPEFDMYADTLDDAIEGTSDALNEAQNAQKSSSSAPIRRKE